MSTEAEREKAVQDERHRLARELHDSVSQSLYGIRLGARIARERLEQNECDGCDIADQIDYVMRLAEGGEAEIRSLIFELQPESLQREGLVAAINRQVEALRALQGSDVEAIADREPEAPIEVKRALHRVAMEALHNTARHAHAHRIEVRLETKGGWVTLEIADDGVGFDSDQTFPGHMGLRSMRERAREVGGSLQLFSAPDQGTRLVVRVPVAPPPQDD